MIKSTYDLYLSKLDTKEHHSTHLTVNSEIENWNLDSIEEFYAAYTEVESYHFYVFTGGKSLSINGNRNSVRVAVGFPTRPSIESIFQIFETNLDKSTIIVETKPIKIFIGHGHDKQWRDLREHIQDQHGINVTAYEIGPRAGLSVKEVLESMLEESSMAFLILTCEDIGTDGEMHARENVVHEVGLFQGRLGFKRAIVVLEDGVHEFSNILGINQIRFSKGNIRETFGDVIATIKRELIDKDA